MYSGLVPLSLSLSPYACDDVLFGWNNTIGYRYQYADTDNKVLHHQNYVWRIFGLLCHVMPCHIILLVATHHLYVYVCVCAKMKKLASIFSYRIHFPYLSLSPHSHHQYTANRHDWRTQVFLLLFVLNITCNTQSAQ